MNITSPAFTHNKSMPAKYTCDGMNCSPPLQFNNVPLEAKSLVLIMEDPDVPRNVRSDGMWTHWLMFNIPPRTKGIPENTEPEGVHGIGTNGDTSYYGPCPPDGEHRYFFKAYALDTILTLKEGVSKKQVEKAIDGHILSEAELVGTYRR